MKKKLFYLLYIITTSFFMACEKEEHLVNKNNEQLPQNPKDTVQNKFIGTPLLMIVKMMTNFLLVTNI